MSSIERLLTSDRKGEAMSARNRTKRLMFAMFCLNLVVMTNTIMAQCVLVSLDVNPETVTVNSSEEHVSIEITAGDGLHWCADLNDVRWIRSRHDCGFGSGTIELVISKNSGSARETYLAISPTSNFDYFDKCVRIQQKSGEENPAHQDKQMKQERPNSMQ